MTIQAAGVVPAAWMVQGREAGMARKRGGEGEGASEGPVPFYWEAFRLHLAKVREAAKLTQPELAEKLGKSSGYVGMYEASKKKRMSVGDWLAWCDACGYDPYWFLFDITKRKRKRRRSKKQQ
jgi:hypothetical protein